MGRIKLSTVKDAEKSWQYFATRYHPDNLAVIRAEQRYRQLKEQYEAQQAKQKNQP